MRGVPVHAVRPQHLDDVHAAVRTGHASAVRRERGVRAAHHVRERAGSHPTHADGQPQTGQEGESKELFLTQNLDC